MLGVIHKSEILRKIIVIFYSLTYIRSLKIEYQSGSNYIRYLARCSDFLPEKLESKNEWFMGYTKTLSIEFILRGITKGTSHLSGSITTNKCCPVPTPQDTMHQLVTDYTDGHQQPWHQPVGHCQCVRAFILSKKSLPHATKVRLLKWEWTCNCKIRQIAVLNADRVSKVRSANWVETLQHRKGDETEMKTVVTAVRKLSEDKIRAPRLYKTDGRQWFACVSQVCDDDHSSFVTQICTSSHTNLSWLCKIRLHRKLSVQGERKIQPLMTIWDCVRALTLGWSAVPLTGFYHLQFQTLSFDTSKCVRQADEVL